jgi:hypothetical protein
MQGRLLALDEALGQAASPPPARQQPTDGAGASDQVTEATNPGRSDTSGDRHTG